jgi:phosphate acetyltransferase
VSPEAARDVMQDATYFGTMMVHLGDAHGMVSGSINTTAHRSAGSGVHQTREARPGVERVLLCCPTACWSGDCAVN